MKHFFLIIRHSIRIYIVPGSLQNLIKYLHFILFKLHYAYTSKEQENVKI